MFHRQHPDELRLQIQVKPRTLISDQGGEACSTVCRRAQKASSEMVAKDWTGVATVIARRHTAKSVAPFGRSDAQACRGRRNSLCNRVSWRDRGRGCIREWRSRAMFVAVGGPMGAERAGGGRVRLGLLNKLVIFLSLVAALSTQSHAQTATFTSPNGLTEECRILPHIPGGKYSKKDVETEQAYCAIDFYETAKVALCPKTWSTSPGTMVYDITESGKTQRDYEAMPSCGGSKRDHNKIAKFKQSMNQHGTSATYSPGPLMYYHLSRYFDTTVDVPVGVYRTMDKDAHYARVAQKAYAKNMGKSRMIRAGWQWLATSEQNPSHYVPTSDLFTPDRKQIFGDLLGGGGVRYGTEINGIRSGGGTAQNKDFQNTPAFLALRSSSPLKQAIAEGVKGGRTNAKINHDLGPAVSDFQMALWMRELSEIVILDYIFAQQDRIGNIDYKWKRYTVDPQAGEVSSEKIDSKSSRAAMKIEENVVQKTHVNDNDAGGRLYTNFTKKTKMLEKLRHLGADTYRKLIALNNDFKQQGERYEYFASNFNLGSIELKQLVTLTNEATGILKATCKAGQMHFDLYDPKALLTNMAVEQTMDCQNPEKEN
jgi:hypothetical protein